MAVDIISRPIAVDDFVYHYNYIFKVLAVGTESIRVLIHPPSKTSKPKRIYACHCCLLPKEDVLLHILKTGEL